MRNVMGFVPVLFFFLLIGTAHGQQPPSPAPSPKPSQPAPPPGPAPCPTVAVQVQPGRPVRDGQLVTFAANIAGGDPKVQPTIIWNTSAGAITQGHNTRRIEVDTTGAGASHDRSVRAEVWIGGYAPECVLQASASAKIIAPAVKFGEFGMVDEQTLKSNLEAVSTYLSQSPDNLYLIAYAGRNSERGFAHNWLKQMRDAIVASGIPAQRIGGVDGGFREEPLFDFWIVPLGAEPPAPAPTVKRSEIVYPRSTPRKKP